MFLRATTRKKDGKEHRYYSVVENKRVSGGRVLQRHVLYLGEINSSQERAWRRSIEVLDEAKQVARTLALFPEDRCEGVIPDESIVRLKLAQLRLERPRQWGGGWLTLELCRSWGSMSSGARDWRPRAKVRVGIRCCLCWWRIGSYPRVASGDCIGTGLRGVRSEICWAPMLRLPTFTRSTVVTTGCSITSRRCSITWWVGGGICSTRASMCSCMTSRARTSSPIRRRTMRISAVTATRAITVPTACKWSSRW